MKSIIEKLKGGDFRSIGNSNEVVEEVLNNPVLFDAVFKAMLNEDRLVRMRAADAVEKITRDHPEYLQPYKTDLIKHVAAVKQQEVRWHTAQMIHRLILTKEEKRTSAEILGNYTKAARPQSTWLCLSISICAPCKSISNAAANGIIARVIDLCWRAIRYQVRIHSRLRATSYW